LGFAFPALELHEGSDSVVLHEGIVALDSISAVGHHCPGIFAVHAVETLQERNQSIVICAVLIASEIRDYVLCPILVPTRLLGGVDDEA
jgi:hypothetical protein